MGRIMQDMENAENIEIRIPQGDAEQEPALVGMEAEPITAVNDDGGAAVMEEPAREEHKGIFKFTRPIMLEGEKVTSIPYDFTRLKPIQYMNIVKAVGAKEPILNPAFNMRVQANLFCKASGLPPAVFNTEVSIPDVQAMCQLAQGFLLSSKTLEEDTLL